MAVQKDLFNNIIKQDYNNLRIPYQGGKQKIAQELMYKMLEIKPNAKYFVDLFAGGGSMSFLALQMGLKVVYNDKHTNLINFVKYIFERIENKQKSKFGPFPEEFYNFVNKEEFDKQKTQDTIFSQFCRICYSFGNGQRNYAFREINVKYKEEGHLYIFEGKKIKGIPETDLKDWNERRLFLCNYTNNKFAEIIRQEPHLIELYKKYCDIIYSNFDKNIMLKFTNWLRNTGIKASSIDKMTNSVMGRHYLAKTSQPTIPTIAMWNIIKTSDKIKNIIIPNWVNSLFQPKQLQQLAKLERLFQPKQLQQLEQLAELQQLQQLQQLEQLQHIQQLEQLGRLQQLERLKGPAIQFFNLDYKDVIINTPHDETIVYLDPPYRNTAEYIEKACNNEIDEYFINSHYSCFMSEYNAPFQSILQINKLKLFNNTNIDIRKYAVENLYYNNK